MSLLDLAAFAAAPLVAEPFPHLLAGNVLTAGSAAALAAAFPPIAQAGLFPAADVAPQAGTAFRDLLDEIAGPAVAEAFSAKFGIDLTGLPLMVTVRGRCKPADGRIHTDSRDKIVTALLYLNEGWSPEGGRLRLLRRGDSLDDPIVEVPPQAGTLVAFRRTDNSWHGHKPFDGPRRYVMFNWMSGEPAAMRETGRHHLSAWVKRLAGAVGLRP